MQRARVLSILGCLAAIAASAAAFPQFAYHRIDRIGSKMGQTALADTDGDGDIDICSKPWSTGNEHFFLRNLLVD